MLALVAPTKAQSTRTGFPFRANNYEVEVLLHPTDQTISGLAKVEFIAQVASRTVVVELHPDLKINKVNVPGGRPLEFERDPNQPLLTESKAEFRMALEGLLPDDEDEEDEALEESFPASDSPATNGTRTHGEAPHGSTGGAPQKTQDPPVGPGHTVPPSRHPVYRPLTRD